VLIEVIDGAPLRQLVARFNPAAEAPGDALAGYTDEQLELILDFTTRSNQANRHLWPNGTRRSA
jgi:hypothetical protein